MNRWQLCCFFFVALAFTLTLAISLTYSRPVGWDINFHLSVMRIWASGQNGMFSPTVMNLNHIPYPPIFHWLLLPEVLFNNYVYVRILQVLFYPLILLLNIWLMKKHYDWKTATIFSLLFIGSVAIFDQSFQVIPQSLEYLLFPIGIHAYLTNKKWLTTSIPIILAYTHGFAALSFCGGIILLLLLERRWKQALTIIGFTLPLIIVSAYFLPPALARWSQPTVHLQKERFLANPLWFIFTYQGSAFLGWFVLPFALRKFRSLNTLDKLSLLTMLSLLIMLPIWQERWTSYISIPLLYLLAPRIANHKKWQATIPILLWFAFAFGIQPWLWLVTNNYVIVCP